MTTDRDFDRIASAWLDLMPDEAPDRVIESVLQAVETTSQARRPILAGRWRFPTMNRLTLIAAVAVLGVALLGGAALFAGRSAQTTPSIAPSGPPTVIPSASAGTAESASPPAALPAAFVYRWLGGARDLPGLGSSTITGLTFSSSSFVLTGTGFGGTGVLDSSATVDGSTLVLTSTKTASGCTVGDAGTYGWAMSPGGTKLTLVLKADACAIRAAAVPGEWAREGCRNPADECWGDLEAGTHATQFISPRLEHGATWRAEPGAITFTVPAGWSNASDWPNTFTLTPSADYANEPPDGPAPGTAHEIFVYTQPLAAVQDGTCDVRADTSLRPTVAELIASLRKLPGLVISPDTKVTIDGHAGIAVDVTLAPAASGTCPDLPSPAVALFAQGGDREDAYAVAISGKERLRVILLDLGDGDVLGINVDSADPARFDELTAAATPIIESFRIR